MKKKKYSINTVLVFLDVCSFFMLVIKKEENAHTHIFWCNILCDSHRKSIYLFNWESNVKLKLIFKMSAFSCCSVGIFFFFFIFVLAHFIYLCCFCSYFHRHWCSLLFFGLVLPKIRAQCKQSNTLLQWFHAMKMCLQFSSVFFFIRFYSFFVVVGPSRQYENISQ